LVVELLTAQAVEMFSALVSHDGSGGKAARMYAGTSARAGNVVLAQSPIVQFCLPGIKGLQSASAKVLIRFVMRRSRIRGGPSGAWIASRRRNEAETSRAVMCLRPWKFPSARTWIQ